MAKVDCAKIAGMTQDCQASCKAKYVYCSSCSMLRYL